MGIELPMPLQELVNAPWALSALFLGLAWLSLRLRRRRRSAGDVRPLMHAIREAEEELRAAQWQLDVNEVHWSPKGQIPAAPEASGSETPALPAELILAGSAVAPQLSVITGGSAEPTAPRPRRRRPAPVREPEPELGVGEWRAAARR